MGKTRAVRGTAFAQIGRAVLGAAASLVATGAFAQIPLATISRGLNSMAS